MKKFLLLFSFLISSLLQAQDTTIVQTLTYDSTGRSYIFDFPADIGQSYEKIIMEYRIRCKGGLVSSGTNTNLGCGEWDYSCNTYITDSAYTDSMPSTHPNYIISGFSGTTFSYTTDTTYSFFQSTQQEMVYSDTTSESIAVIGAGTNSSSFPFNITSNRAKIQYLISSSDLTGDGLLAGDLSGLGMDLDALGDEINNLRIKIKETSATQLDTLNPELIGFTTVYYLNTDFQSTGWHQFNFATDFTWDGTSNLIIEFSFDQSLGTASYVKSESILNAGIASTNADYSLKFNGTQTVLLDNSFPSISNEITVSFWAFGSEEALPANTTVFHGIDNVNNRQVNVHLPWSNSRIYWDCGNDGTGYDRIDKEANVEDFEGKWNHWAFTKNASTGSMKIYLNGSLWHSGSGKTRAIDLQSFTIGSDQNIGNAYSGNLDEFQIWDTELSAGEIADYMYSTIPSTHPSFGNLVAYYKFNDGLGDSPMDNTGLHPATALNNPQWRIKNGQDLFLEFNTLSERPNMKIVQGIYTYSINDFIVLDSLANAANSIKEYSVISNDLILDSTYYYYQSGDMAIIDENGNDVGSVNYPEEGSLEISSLAYYLKSPMNFEIMSFVTPYGINLDLGEEGKMWQFDVTDFTPILKGSKQLSVIFGNYQEEMDIRFLYISGTPPRDVLSIQQIWRAGVQRSYADISNDAYAEPRDIVLNPLGSSFKVRSAISGHGQEGEFIQRTHFIDLDGGTNEFSWQVWKECADNPIFPQGGTWIYDRAGWCPGAPTDLEEFEITSLVTPGDIVNFDYGIVTANGDSRYLVNNQLVTYGAANFELDAGIVEIQRPSNRIEYDRVNPICFNPIIIIQNTGSTTLTSLSIRYFVDGGTEEVFEWTGDLAFMEKEEVILPISDASFWSGNGNEVFNVSLDLANGSSDDYSNNNVMESPFTLPVVYNSIFYVRLKTNNYGFQNSYRVKDIDGNIVFTKSNFENNTTYRDTLYLEEGCYTFEFDDTGDDGLYFWANSAQGSGYVRFTEVASGNTIQTFEREFGKNIRHAFSLGNGVGVQELENTALFDIYPNPTTNQFKVDVELDNTSDIELIIHDITGREIERREYSGFKEGTISFDLQDQTNGVYYCTLLSKNNKQTKKIVLNK